MSLDIDACIATLKEGETVSEREIRQLCQYVGELLIEESNVQPVLSPVTIVGDLHGQFFDLLNLFENVGGWPPETSYIFLGCWLAQRVAVIFICFCVDKINELIICPL